MQTLEPSDTQQIADLMTGWLHRDLGEWEKLRALFHPDATIEVTWFSGKASEFVDQSMKMGKSALKTKHMVSSPVITSNGNKAIAETNAMIVAQNLELGVCCVSHCRFFDHLEKRGLDWKFSSGMRFTIKPSLRSHAQR